MGLEALKAEKMLCWRVVVEKCFWLEGLECGRLEKWSVVVEKLKTW